MDKILEVTLTRTAISFENDKPVLNEIKDKCWFSLLTSSHRLFETLYGSPLLSTLSDGANEADGANTQKAKELFLDSKFINSLAAACYLKVEGSEVVNTEFTAQEFLKMNYDISMDIDFIQKMMSMITECLPKSKSKKKKADGKKSKK